MDYSLCVITENVPELGRTHLEVARAAIEGGATVVQLREKKPGPATERLALKIRRLTEAAGAGFIVNDWVELAAAARADGVHLGQGDRPAQAAREALGDRAVIGMSAASPAEALEAEAHGVADYLGVGPIFPTPSKADAAEPIGLTGLGKIRATTRLPLVAIGGINEANAGRVMRAGADGIAVISAVSRADDMVAAAARLLAQVTREQARKEQVSR